MTRTALPYLFATSGQPEGSCRLRLLIEVPTKMPMSNPISLSPQLTFQATSLPAGSLATEISQTLQGLLVQQQFQLGHGHHGGGSHEIRRARRQQGGSTPEISHQAAAQAMTWWWLTS